MASEFETARAVRDEMIRGGCANLSVTPRGPWSCRLAIVNAGMPRSGSTLVGKLITEAVSMINSVSNSTGRVRGPFYWNHHLRRDFSDSGVGRNDSATAKCAARRAYYFKILNLLSSLTNSDTLLIKSHEFDAGLLGICEKVLVVSSVRDLAESAFSKVRLGWNKIPPGISQVEAAEVMVNASLQAVKEFNCWKRYSPRYTQMLYQDFSKSFGAAIMRIMALILEAIPLPVGQQPLVVNIDAINEKFSKIEGNKDMPSTHRVANRHANLGTSDPFAKVLTPFVAMKIREAYVGPRRLARKPWWDCTWLLLLLLR